MSACAQDVAQPERVRQLERLVDSGLAQVRIDDDHLPARQHSRQAEVQNDRGLSVEWLGAGDEDTLTPAGAAPEVETAAQGGVFVQQLRLRRQPLYQAVKHRLVAS